MVTSGAGCRPREVCHYLNSLRDRQRTAVGAYFAAEDALVVKVDTVSAQVGPEKRARHGVL